MTRSKTPLLLTEAVVMLLVFSAAAAVCLRLFAAAREDARDGRDLSRAAAWAASAADCYLAADGDLQAAAGLLDAELEGDRLVLRFDASWNRGGDRYLLTVTEADGLGSVSVSGQDGMIFQIQVKAVSGLG